MTGDVPADVVTYGFDWNEQVSRSTALRPYVGGRDASLH